MHRGGSFPCRWLVPAALSAALSASSARAAPAAIVVDGAFDDWAGVNPAAIDPPDDGGASGIDFGSVWTAGDAGRLLLRFECGRPLVAQSANALALYMDTDGDAATGAPIAGIGADLVWRFGERAGTYRGRPVGWREIGLVVLPSDASSAFELSLRRDAAPGGAALFPSPRVRLVLADAGPRGDRVPGANRSIDLQLEEGAHAAAPEIPLGRAGPRTVRLLSYNVERDGPRRRPSEHARILRAAAPDVIAYQEMAGHDAREARDWVRSVLPGAWSVAAAGDRRTLARWPIQGVWETAEGRATAALVDLPDTLGGALLVVNLHLSCCDEDLRRRRQVDALLSFLRDARAPGGEITLAPETGIVIAGDTNSYGRSDLIEALANGWTLDEGEFGPDFAPDWDGSPLRAPIARHAGALDAYTYRDDEGPFAPSLIDRVFFTGSVLERVGGYILETGSLRPETLHAQGLESGDAARASDHLPLVVDLAPRAPAREGTRGAPAPLAVALDPNPVAGGAGIAFALPEPGRVTVALFDTAGRRVALLFDSPLAAGPHAVPWRPDAALPSGVYLVRLEAGGRRGVARAVLLR